MDVTYACKTKQLLKINEELNWELQLPSAMSVLGLWNPTHLVTDWSSAVYCWNDLRLVTGDFTSLTFVSSFIKWESQCLFHRVLWKTKKMDTR